MDLALFFGRFHPLVVHLPIGFLLLAGVLEGLSVLYPHKFKNMNRATSIALFCTGLTALFAAFFGYLLAREGGYDANILLWHKWLGIALIPLSFLAWAMKAERIALSTKNSALVIISLVVLVSITGHYGGKLTHGSDYLLVYAPRFVQKIGGMEMGQSGHVAALPDQVDSIAVYKHLIAPTLEKKCYACHNDTKSNGGLLLATTEGLFEGGDSGPALMVGQPFDSPIFLRTILPQRDQKFMPPKGEPLTYGETKILQWWIESGGDPHARITDTEVPAEIQKLLLNDYGIDTKPKPYYETVVVAPLSIAHRDKLQSNGWNVRPLGGEVATLEVSLADKTITSEQVALLAVAAEQITWLDLANKSVADEMLQTIGQLSNLTRLELNNNPITDQGLQQGLQELQHLEVLNMYGTQITDASIPIIAKMKSLRRIYLWQTEVSPAGMQQLETALPNLKIIGGLQ